MRKGEGVIAGQIAGETQSKSFSVFVSIGVHSWFYL